MSFSAPLFVYLLVPFGHFSVGPLKRSVLRSGGLLRRIDYSMILVAGGKTTIYHYDA